MSKKYNIYCEHICADLDGCSKLMYTLTHNWDDTSTLKRVKLELEKCTNWDLNIQSEGGYTPLMFAAIYTSFDVFSLILKRRPNLELKTTTTKMTVLNIVLYVYWNIPDRIEKFRALIQAGAKLNKYICDDATESPLFQVIKLSYNDKNLTMLKLYRELGGRMIKDCVSNSDGKLTALMISVKANHMSIVKYLLDEGFDVNYQNKKGLTALMRAARHSNDASSIEMVKFLLERGADRNLVNKNGETAADLAFKYRESTSNIETFKLLQKKVQVWNEECPICFSERVKPTALIPCGHILCQDCIQDIENCPCCRTVFNDTLTVYL